MSKKAAPEPSAHHGFNDVLGVMLVGGAVLLLAALISYDAHDLAANYLPKNNPTHNWIGPVGAWLADKWIKAAGLSAYGMPFVMIFVGLGCFFDKLAFVRRRWFWAVVLFLCSTGLFGLYD